MADHSTRIIEGFHTFCQAFAKEGAKVIATDIQAEKLKELEASGE